MQIPNYYPCELQAMKISKLGVAEIAISALILDRDFITLSPADDGVFGFSSCLLYQVATSYKLPIFLIMISNVFTL